MPADDVFSFQCPHCNHRLKAKGGAAGRRAKCSRCQKILTIPELSAEFRPPPSITPPSTAPSAAVPKTVEQTASTGRRPPALSTLDKVDWLKLGHPAIADLSDRQKAHEAHQEASELARKAKQNKQQQRKQTPATHDTSGSEPIGKLDRATAGSVDPTHRGNGAAGASQLDDLDDVFRLASLDSSDPRVASQKSKPPAGGEHDAKKRDVKRSVFEDDLPELAELLPSSKPARKLDDVLAAHLGEDSLASDPLASDPLASLVPSLEPLPKTKAKAKPKVVNEKEDPEYRVSCLACGTVQYVRLSQKGKKIQCPDCFLKFEIPAPPHGWIPDAEAQRRARENDWHSSSADALQAADPQTLRRTRTSRMLEKAEQQAADEELDRLYDSDFDTADFLQRTFGFLKDPVAIAYIFGYAIVFAIIFAAGQFAANQADSPHGKGILLAVMIGAPVVGLMFAMPMLSGGIALIESVANRQQRVADWPGFNLFDNAGDMLAITTALIGSVIPGFLLGTWLGGEDPGAGRMQIAGMMASSFVLFPVFLLSMLDNGSLFAPISNSIIRSFREASEAWGGYFLKTFIAFVTVMLLWLLLLGEGKPIALAAIAGCLFPLLVFFTCQQIGALADSIGEHLSFEFVPPSSEDEDAAQT